MTLRENLAALEDEELLFKVTSSSLTEEAEAIARELLAARGVDIPDPVSEVATPTTSPVHLVWFQLLKTSFQGKAPLGVAYSVSGITTLAFILLMVLGMMMFQSTFLSPLFDTGLFLVLVLGFPMQAFCVWRCSENTKSRLWSAIAMLYSMIVGVVVAALILAAMFG